MSRLLLVTTLAVTVSSCQQEPTAAPPRGSDGQRDNNAVAIKLHNRTDIDLVIRTLVREGQTGHASNTVLRLQSPAAVGPFEPKSDRVVKLFEALPLKLDRVGAYSIEVLSDSTEARLWTLDVTVKEMDKAKSTGKFVLVFRQNEVSVTVGDQSWKSSWMRPLPRPKMARREKVDQYVGDKN